MTERIVDRVDEREGPRAARLVERKREDLVAVRRAGGEQEDAAALVRDGGAVDVAAVRREIEAIEPMARRALRDELVLGARVRAVGAERHQARQAAAGHDRRAADADVVAAAVEVADVARAGERAFIDRAARIDVGKHRHVVDDRDAEVARQRDRVLVEVEGLDEAREVDGLAVLALAGRLVDRIEQRERPLPGTLVERQREDRVTAALVRARGEHLVAVAVGREGRDVDLVAMRRNIEAREPRVRLRLRDQLERVGGRPVGAEGDQVPQRAGRGRGGEIVLVVVAVALVVAGAVEIADRGRVVQGAFVDRAGRVREGREHRHVVLDRDRKIAGQRRRVAVEIDRLDEAREVEARAVLSPARRVVDRVEQREGPRPRGHVEREGEHLVATAVRAVRAAVGPGRERLGIGDGRAVGRGRRRDGGEIDCLAVRGLSEPGEPGSCRALADELEAVRDRLRDRRLVMEVAERGTEGVGMRPVGAEAHEVRERAAHDGRRMRIVALAVEIGAALIEVVILELLQPAFVDQTRAARRGEHRHVVDDVDLEVGRERDHVAVEIGRLDQAREVEGGRILALGGLIERVDQRERVGAVAVERQREDLVAAVPRAAVGPGRERLRGAVGAVGHR